MTEPAVQFTRDHGFWLCTVRHRGLLYLAEGSTLEGAAEVARLTLATRRVPARYANALAELRTHFAMVLDSIHNPDGLEPNAAD